MSLSPTGLLQPLPIPDVYGTTFLWISLKVYQSPKGMTILVVVDHLSKYAHFVGLKHPFTAKTVAVVFVKEIVRLHGFPHSIVSIRDKVFASHFWEELFKLQGTSLCRSTTYHPQTDG